MKTQLIIATWLMALSAISAPATLCGFEFGSAPKLTMQQPEKAANGRVIYTRSVTKPFRGYKTAKLYFADKKLLCVLLVCDLPKKSTLSDLYSEYNITTNLLSQKFDVKYRHILGAPYLANCNIPISFKSIPYHSFAIDSDNCRYLVIPLICNGKTVMGKPCDEYKILFYIDYPKFPLDSQIVIPKFIPDKNFKKSLDAL